MCPFRGPKRSFLGFVLSAGIYGCVCVCKIIQIAKIRSPFSLIPSELSNASKTGSIGGRSDSGCYSQSILPVIWFITFFNHSFFSSASLTPHRSHPWVEAPRTGSQYACSTPIVFQAVIEKTFHFSKLVSPFRGPKQPFLGFILSPGIYGCVCVYKIIQIAKIKSPLA